MRSPPRAVRAESATANATSAKGIRPRVVRIGILLEEGTDENTARIQLASGFSTLQFARAGFRHQPPSAAARCRNGSGLVGRQRPPVAFRYLSSSESVDRISQVLSSIPLPSVSSVFRNW